jgi:2-dehydropantoate 2-reductase
MLLKAGRDVTFLVRPQRHAQLARDRLRIIGPDGEMTVTAPAVQAGSVDGSYDVVLVALKQYALADAIEQIAPAVGPRTAILPVINGMRHVDELSARFGEAAMLAGTARIGVTMDDEGRVVLLLPNPRLLTFGELGQGRSARVSAIEAFLSGANFQVSVSEHGRHELWTKWCNLAAFAATTCMMRGSLGDIATAPGGRDYLTQVLMECAAVSDACGYTMGQSWVDATTAWITSGANATASMLRDIERGVATEGDHILGDLVARANAAGVAVPLLSLARCHVACYDIRRQRESQMTN